jgi:saccharopine dehydrogenase-like NADP-dependent oxidoreductase
MRRNEHGCELESTDLIAGQIDRREWNMRNIVVVGAGNIGRIITRMLAQTGDYFVTVADRDEKTLACLADQFNVTTKVTDITDDAALDALMREQFAVLSAAPFNLTLKVAEAAARAKIHYLDLTEDVATTRRVKELAEGAQTAFIPQCGLAPGFIAIVAADLAREFDTLDTVRMRVGALPQFPSNALNYNLTWSTDGVINEYIEPCEAIVDSRIQQVPAMEEREEFSLDGVRYEAFNTSGGLGTLCESLHGRVRTLNYRSIRYPGHCAIMKALLNDLRLRDRRDVLKDILENALPTTMQDVVIIFVTVSGMKDGVLLQQTYAHKVYAEKVDSELRSAIQITTASGICTVLDLLASGELTQRGFVRQEDIALDDFLANRFAAPYRQKPVPSSGQGGGIRVELAA